MVNGQFVAAIAAVLAGVVITLKHIAAREGQLLERNTNKLPQPNHGGGQEILTEIAFFVLKPFRLPLQHHHSRSAPAGDIERLVRRIENEDVAHASFPYCRHAIWVNQ